MTAAGSRAGLTLAVLSAATFGTSGAFASSLIEAGWSPAAAVITRVAVAAAVLTVPALIQLRGRWSLLRRGAGRAAAYGLVAVAGCQLFYFNAIERMPVGVALLLEYLAAVLVVGWLWLRHGQRPRRLTVAGAAAAIAGLAMVLDLAGSARIDPVGVMWGLLRRRGPRDLLPARGGHGRGAAAADRHGVGRDVRRRRRPRRARLDRCPAADRDHRQRRLPRPPGQLGRAGAGAVAGGRGDRLCRGHRRRPRSAPSSPRSSAWPRCCSRSCSPGCCWASCRPPCSSWAARSSSRESRWYAPTS